MPQKPTFVKHSRSVAGCVSGRLDRGERLLVHHFPVSRRKTLKLRTPKSGCKHQKCWCSSRRVNVGVLRGCAVHIERNLLAFTAAVVRTHGVHGHLQFNLDAGRKNMSSVCLTGETSETSSENQLTFCCLGLILAVKWDTLSYLIEEGRTGYWRGKGSKRQQQKLCN